MDEKYIDKMKWQARTNGGICLIDFFKAVLTQKGLFLRQQAKSLYIQTTCVVIVYTRHLLGKSQTLFYYCIRYIVLI